MLHFIIKPHVQTQSNRVCNFHVFLLLLILPRYHTLSRFYFTFTYRFIDMINYTYLTQRNDYEALKMHVLFVDVVAPPFFDHEITWRAL
jgi:hypothetical protein